MELTNLFSGGSEWVQEVSQDLLFYANVITTFPLACFVSK